VIGRLPMTEPRDAQRILSNYLEAVMRKDSGMVDRFFHPDVEYVVNGDPDAKLDSWIPPISRECLTALPWLGLHRRPRGVWLIDIDGERRSAPSALIQGACHGRP
jgi:hypothetical protein